MAFTYDINKTKIDKTSNTCLLICHLILGVTNTFVTTFLVAYIYGLSSSVYDYIFNVGVYYLSTYVTMLVMYYLLSIIVEKTNRVWFYRIGLLFGAGLVVLLIYCGQNIAQMLVLAGVLYGTYQSFYYASYNVMKHEMVSRKFMKKFTVLSTVLSKVVSIIIPVTLGAIIEISTYAQTSIYVLIICAIQIAISFGIKSKKPEGSNFSIKGYLKKLNKKPEVAKKMKFIYASCLVYGFCTIVTPLMNVCIMLNFGSNLSLGYLTSIFAVVATLFILIVNKFTFAGKRTWLFIATSILPIAGCLLFMFMPSKATLIVYNVCVSLNGVLYSLVFDIYRNGTLKEAGLYSEIAEHQTVVESLFCISRIVAFGIIILLSLIKNQIAVNVMLLISVFAYAGILWLLAIFEKKHLKTNTEEKPIENEQKSDIIVSELALNGENNENN